MSPPKGYGDKESAEDWIRLAELARKREAGIALSTEEDAEEAHRNARFDCYAEGPEQTARRRRRHLEAADKSFRENRFFKDLKPVPLSRKERSELWLLRWLYPPPHSKSQASAEAEAEALADAERWIGHPFHDEKPAADGNLYPHVILHDEDVEIPPYCICISGQRPFFTYEPPTGSSSDKSDPTQPSPEATPPGS